ncbi:MULTISPECIES: alkyl sulfatase dimerization domain-containing protein [unclassified Streptomyces]|uniref:alkyl/aryl-sulfatase n=1 Tax=unclassified Streptomyces TaxID=2593676 RepID=UPI000DB9E6D8|nr:MULTISPECIES: alkyl sulfatase dimerization domain-containing protein [unclassified Streptomyces]MYT70456.1 MBL fold metallo-hydrolase [Streptomyces sp. SID8367]RAJ90155.1 alkyl sulfatase BDS1-like metallo-beta-lactamase superfamily hydrolase [Streptomyces sp. PsTaAH-137]
MSPINRRRFVAAAAGAAAAAMAVNPESAVAAQHRTQNDTGDFEAADKGFIAALKPGVVKNADGKVVWDNDAYAFLKKEAPETANKSLWRQSQLASRQGLYKVTDRIYQVRGLDLSNMTIVEGDTGIIVIDPLISAETAAAALKLYRAHRGERKVTALIYTHPHVDHFGGAYGVLPEGAGDVPVVAPEGFLEHAVSENVYAGTAMNRRSAYMYGAHLPRSAKGQIGCGLGQSVSLGTVGLIPPTKSIARTGQVETFDGVAVEFQMTPGTEAPAEMNFVFPGLRAVCMAENATHTMHNIITLRGAQVRDAREWARYLNESVELFAGRVDVAFASHHWPTWGGEEIGELLASQRDLYAYMHDQTLRMINVGMTGREIAEAIELPPALDVWANRGYYGSLSHNVKGIYQRYMGWFDANPAHLWEHPPVDEAKRYVKALGGRSAAIAKAKGFERDGDLRFAATLLNHVVFADPGSRVARRELARIYTRLGYATENAVWRNFYLTGALELTEGVRTGESSTVGPTMMMALSIDQLIDSVAIRINGPKAWDLRVRMDWSFPSLGVVYHLTVRNGVLTYRSDEKADADAGVALSMTKVQLLGLLGGKGLGDIEVSGDASLLQKVLAVVEKPDPSFAIVTP